MAGKHVVGDHGAEVNEYQFHICLIWHGPLSKCIIVIWIWINSELFQSPPKPGSAAGSPLEELHLSTSNSLIQLELEMTRCPRISHDTILQLPIRLTIMGIESRLWEINVKQCRMIEIRFCFESVAWWGLGPTWCQVSAEIMNDTNREQPFKR
jgi:hypothetical protein